MKNKKYFRENTNYHQKFLSENRNNCLTLSWDYREKNNGEKPA